MHTSTNIPSTVTRLGTKQYFYLAIKLTVQFTRLGKRFYSDIQNEYNVYHIKLKIATFGYTSVDINVFKTILLLRTFKRFSILSQFLFCNFNLKIFISLRIILNL